MYPNFETTGKEKILGQSGWGAKDLSFKSTIRQFGPALKDYNKSIDRGTLVHLDKFRANSMINASAEFKRTDDISVEDYLLKNPADANIPLRSLEMQRKPAAFQETQRYMHKKGVREASYNANPRYVPGPIAEY